MMGVAFLPDRQEGHEDHRMRQVEGRGGCDDGRGLTWLG